MTKPKTLKAEYLPGGSKRQEILDKAVGYLTSRNPYFGNQADRKWFLLNQLMMTETEYMEALNKATNGGIEAWAN